MRRDPRRIADPEREQGLARAQVQDIVLRDAVEKLMDIDRAQIDGRHLIGGQALRLVEAGEDVGQAALAHAEIDPHGLVVEEAPANAGVGHGDGEVQGARAIGEIGPHRAVALPRRPHQRPVADQAAQDEGRFLAREQRVERRRVRHRQLPHRGQRRERAVSHRRSGGSCARPAR